MIVFSLTCRSELCQRGTRCSMWTQPAALPSSMHFLQNRYWITVPPSLPSYYKKDLHASCTLMLVNRGSPVVLSRILRSRV